MNVNLVRWPWLPLCQRRGNCTRSLWFVAGGVRIGTQLSLRFIAHYCSLCQAGPDSGSGKSLAIPTTKWDSPGEKATTQQVLAYSSFFLFSCRTRRGGLSPGREVESNAPLKKSGFAFATSFFPPFSSLAIYHDHLSMPINIIIQHQKSFEIIEGR